MIQKGPTSEQVIAAVVAASKVSRADILGPSRARRVTRTRQLAAYIICRHCTWLTLAQIGRKMKKDHTTIIHARRVVPGFLEEDRSLRDTHNTALAFLGIGAFPFDPREGKALRMTPYAAPKLKPKAPPRPRRAVPKVPKRPDKPKSSPPYQKPAAAQVDPKRRDCLMCNRSFISSWPGERVCKRCKDTARWQDGGYGESSMGRRL